ncbi:MAG: TetR family transcriptional regulator [Thermoleophilaceae bacterium]|nr:TetR family transcriptional regulator [Thermoleophilaceae bacterium]
MEASTKQAPRKLDSDKAQRIVAAMRESVAVRGAAASTFDAVAAEAGVSRGLLHYYFGSKERLLVEVVRHDCALRMESLGAQLVAATSVEDIVTALSSELEEYLDPTNNTIIFELFSASRHNEELRVEMAELYRQIRGKASAALEEKEREGVVTLRHGAEATISMLFALGDGFVLQLVSDPEWDSAQAFAAGFDIARYLLGAGE